MKAIPVDSERGGITAALLGAGALAIGHALQVSQGIYNDIGVIWLGVGVALSWAGILSQSAIWRKIRISWENRFDREGDSRHAIHRRQGIYIRRSIVAGTVLAGIGWQIWQLSYASPLPVELKRGTYFYWTALPLLGVFAAGSLVPGRPKRIFFVLFLAAHFCIGAWLLETTTKPVMDVYEVTKDACAAMSRGQNPYAIDFPDVYAGRPDWEKAFYQPGLIHDGRVNFGYPYMPVTFAVEYAGYLIGGDYRLGNLAAIAIAGALMGYAQA